MKTIDQIAQEIRISQKKILCGISGGADSAALLLSLYKGRTEGQDIIAVHVNHALRGEASDADQTFVENLCARLNIPLDVYRLTPPAHASQNWARESRYQAFRESYNKHHAEVLVLAHHRDDQTETVLLHMLRGTGLNGLCGMSVRSESFGMLIERPLLKFTRNDIREALIDAGQAWREDESNSGDLYLRNRIRHELVPMMERLAPGAAERIAAMSELLRLDRDMIEHVTSEMTQQFDLPYLDTNEISQNEPELLMYTVRKWFHAVTGIIADRMRTDQLESMVSASPGSKKELLNGWTIYRGWRYLHLYGRDNSFIPYDIPVSELGHYIAGDVDIDITAGGNDYGDGILCQEMPMALVKQCSIRTWHQGDFIRPFGQKGRQSLQDYFVNQKIDAPFRKKIPLLCRDNEVLFAFGIGCGSVPHWDGKDQARVTASGTIPWIKRSIKEKKNNG